MVGDGPKKSKIKKMNWNEINNFTEDEFKCKCGCGRADMDLSFVKKLDQIREDLDFPLIISSGFRCPDHNDNVSSTGRDGPHTTGKAADVKLSYETARKFLSEATHWFNGIGVNQKGEPGTRFIHVDSLGDRVWSY